MTPLKPQDLVVLIKLALWDGPTWTYAQVAASLGMSASEIHAAVKRSLAATLMDPDTRRPNVKNLLELMLHGVRFVFIPHRGPITMGVPTAHAAPPLRERVDPVDDIPPVWPHPEGTVRGERLDPLYPAAVGASLRDPKLYECLALIDALRISRPRERTMAANLLVQRLARAAPVDRPAVPPAKID